MKGKKSKHIDTSGSSYAYDLPQYSYETAFFATTDATSFDDEEILSSNRKSRQSRKKNFKLLPVKVKDIVGMVENNSDYAGKSPVMINMRENELNEIIEQQRAGNSVVLTASPKSFRKSMELIPPKKTSIYEIGSTTNPPLGQAQTPQVYAMTDYPIFPMADIQAFPAVGGSGFRIKSSRPVITRQPRTRRRIRGTRSLSRPGFLDRFRSRGRTRSRPRVRVRSSKRAIRPRVRSRTPSRPVIVKQRHRTPVRVRRRTPVRVKRRKTPILRTRKRRPVFERPCNTGCAPYPLCDRQCNDNYCTRWSPNRSRAMLQCDCNPCQERMQFIQPGVCTKKKAMWTNEYAIIPKPQVNLIDPCEKLDPIIYPRADRPCIRDGRGNPLTDCIGRPLRDPVGKNFMRLSANGSLLETNFRGNYHTGQPPLCVKCPLFDIYSCKPDTTHNWWVGCGYPILPNMTPFYNNFVTTENVPRY